MVELSEPRKTLAPSRAGSCCDYWGILGLLGLFHLLSMGVGSSVEAFAWRYDRVALVCYLETNDGFVTTFS